MLSRGIADPEIQLSILRDQNQDMTFEEVLQLVEAKESGKLSASRFLESQGTDAMSSTYRREKRKGALNALDRFGYCGKRGHGKSAAPHIRKTACPAYDHRCEHCKREHHYGDMFKGQD